MNKTEIKALISLSLTKPSKSFGALVLEPNHRVIGDALRKYRVEKRVKGASVARVFQIDRSALAHLEKGVNKWSLALIERYVKIVEQIAKEKRRIRRGEAA